MNLEAQYERAACGLLTTRSDGVITAVNQTLLDWIGRARDEIVGRRFVDLLTAGGRIYHETHYAPMLGMQGFVREIAFELACGDTGRFPVLVNARVDSSDRESAIHVAVFDATERRSYERELLAAKERAEASDAQARILARTLQDTLLPHRVPVVPGLDIAAVYLAAGEGHEIGGDFYDVFQIASDDWVIALGDVEGKGVEAALVTALVRYTIRAASVQLEPAGVLSVVNDVLLRDESQRYCTAVVLRCRRRDAHWTITIASGGHPLPVLAHPHGVEPVGRHGTLLGLVEDVSFHDVDVRLDRSRLLVAYTDGVSEARRDGQQFGDASVVNLIAGHVDQSPAVVLERIVEGTLQFGGRPNQDDIAAMAIRPSDVDDTMLTEGRGGPSESPRSSAAAGEPTPGTEGGQDGN